MTVHDKSCDEQNIEEKQRISSMTDGSVESPSSIVLCRISPPSSNASPRALFNDGDSYKNNKNKSDCSITRLSTSPTSSSTPPFLEMASVCDDREGGCEGESSLMFSPLNLQPLHVNGNNNEKFNRGLDLFAESVMKPDHALRQCAHNQKCYHELMWVREHVLEYLKTLRQ